MLQLLQKKLGAHTAFIGKAGKDMHGEFLKSVLEKEKVDTKECFWMKIISPHLLL